MFGLFKARPPLPPRQYTERGTPLVGPGKAELRNDKDEVIASHYFPEPIGQYRAMMKLREIAEANGHS